MGMLLLSAISVPVMVFSSGGLPRLRHLEQEKKRASEEVSRLSQEIRRLRAETQRAQGDPAMVERVARDELGLVRQTEVVFQFDD